MEIVARGRGLEVRVVLIWTGRCLVDLAYAAPSEAAHPAAFEDFVAGFRVSSARGQVP